MYSCKSLAIMLAAAALLLGFASAIPAPRRIHRPKHKTHVAPASCQTYYPSVLRQIHEAHPDVMQPNTANTTRSFHVAQSVSAADKVKFDRIHQHVVFDNIAPGSWDCQLMVSWPDSETSDMVVSSSSKAGTLSTSGVSLDVYSAYYNTTAYNLLAQSKDAALDSPITNAGPFSTWTTLMATMKMMGNTKHLDKTAGHVNATLTYFGTVAVNPGEYGITINSKACPSSTTRDGNGKTLEFLFEIPNFESRDTSVRFSAHRTKDAGVYLLANC